MLNNKGLSVRNFDFIKYGVGKYVFVQKETKQKFLCELVRYLDKDMAYHYGFLTGVQENLFMDLESFIDEIDNLVLLLGKIESWILNLEDFISHLKFKQLNN